MNNHLTKKLITIFLLALFAGDTLALWDMAENFGIGFHAASIDNEETVEFHMHESGQTEHESKEVDTCTLCPCCVSHVSILISDFYLSIFVPQNSVFTLKNPEETSWYDHQFFHPPRFLFS